MVACHRSSTPSVLAVSRRYFSLIRIRQPGRPRCLLSTPDGDRRRELFGDTWSWLVTDSFNGLLEAHQVTNQDDEFAGPASTSRSLDAALAEYAAAGTRTQGKTPRTSASVPPSSFLPSCFTCSRS